MLNQNGEDMSLISNCNDGAIDTVCKIIRETGQVELTIDTTGLYFDQILLRGIDTSVFGLTLSVFVNSSEAGVPFWEHRISDVRNIYAFDISEEAMSNFPFRLISTFSYNGELAAFFLVKQLFDVVNEFIIVESGQTYRGDTKPQYYFETPETRAQFAPYMSKITYVKVPTVPERPDGYITADHAWMDEMSYDAWWRDNFQRVVVKNYIDGDTKALYICGDADEIPDKVQVGLLRDETLYDSVFSKRVHFEMLHFNYNFNWLAKGSWVSTFVLNTEAYLAIPDMVQARFDRIGYQLIPNGGWHLSYFMSKADMVRKIESFAHRELDQAPLKTEEHVSRVIREGGDMYMRDLEQDDDCFRFRMQPIVPVNFGHFLPQYWDVLRDMLMAMQQ